MRHNEVFISISEAYLIALLFKEFTEIFELKNTVCMN